MWPVLLSCARAPPASAPAAGDWSALVEALLPRVALVVNVKPSGAIGYGSGIVLDDSGQVLTNLHVIQDADQIAVMFHDARRTSYASVDGGLSRFLFENRNDLVPARLVRGDAVVDLALLQVDGSSPALPTLALEDAAVRVGEPVLALGHPQENVWSFTSGMVSAVHQGQIQHDAAINQGSSGGPLVDLRGAVVGVNTMKLLGGTDGIAYARPLSLAARLREGSRDLVLDLSTPETATRSCARAVELGSPSFADCFDWRSLETAVRSAVGDDVPPQGAIEVAAEGVRLALEAAIARTDADVIRERLAAFQGSHDHLAFEYAEDAPPAAPAPVVADPRSGAKFDPSSLEEWAEHIKLGIRIEQVTRVDDLAFVAIVGRNHDGTEFRFTQTVAEVDGRWLQPIFVEGTEPAPPGGFPPRLPSFFDLSVATDAKTE